MTALNRICEGCGAEFQVAASEVARGRGRFCSRACAGRCGGSTPRPSKRYKQVGHKQAHRVIMEQVLGRPLAADEDVHHIDGNKQNNDPANLRVLKHSEHLRQHLRERWRKDPNWRKKGKK